MRKIDSVLAAIHTDLLFTKLYLFRQKYGIGDAALWDLILLYLVYKKHGCGITRTGLTELKYVNSKAQESIKQRLDRLVVKNLIFKPSRGMFQLTPSAIKEISDIMSSDEPEELHKAVKKLNKIPRSRLAK